MAPVSDSPSPTASGARMAARSATGPTCLTARASICCCRLSGTSPMQPAIPTVFVVDDDEGVRNSLRFLLKSVGLNTRALSSAIEFLDTYKPSQPGCLVLDVRMPGMSGLELQQQLNLRGATIPVIFITGHGDIPMAVEAMQHGAFDFLQKPFRDQDLIDRLQRALAKDGKTRAALKEHERI